VPGIQTDSLIAAAFVAARQQGSLLINYPGPLPDGLEAAYAIQRRGIMLTGVPVVGWKVGRLAPDLAARFGTERLGGPIFQNRMIDAIDGSKAAVPVLPGFAAAEAEVLVQLRETPPPGLNQTALEDYISAVRFGLEIASSPFPGINDHGPAVTISDFGNNFGAVLGPAIENWRGDGLAGRGVETLIDGVCAGTGVIAAGGDGPWGAALFLINLLHAQGRPPGPGTWISTGALTGIHEIAPGMEIEARLEGAGAVTCRAVALAGGTHV